MKSIKKNIKYLYIGITVVAILAALILGVRYRINRKAEKTENAGIITAKTAEEKEKKDKVKITIDTEMIKEHIENMGFLITQEYYFTQVETYTKEKTVFYFIPSSSEFVYSYDGAVMAGVDFADIGISTDEDRKVITVDIPDSEIHGVTIDKSTFQIFSEKDSIWNPLGLEDYNISLTEFEERAKEKAIKSGILERSDDQAEYLVREFIGSLPNTLAYTVEFE